MQKSTLLQFLYLYMINFRNYLYCNLFSQLFIFLKFFKSHDLLRTAKRGGGKEGDEETLATGWNPKKSGE